MKLFTSATREKTIDFAISQIFSNFPNFETNAERPAFGIFYSTTGYDQNLIVSKIAEKMKGIPWIGCSVEGTITKDLGSVEATHVASLGLFYSSKVKFTPVMAKGLSADSSLAAKNILEQVKSIKDIKAMIVLPDGLTCNNTALLQTLSQGLPEGCPVLGGLASESLTFQKTYQYFQGEVISDSVVGFALSGPVEVHHVVAHGCEPIGLGHQVTESRGPWIDQIDHRPAWDVFKEYLDGNPQTLTAQDVGHMCIGEKVEPVLNEYDQYIIRTTLALDASKGAIFLPCEIPSGTRIQMTRRDPEKIKKTAGEAADRLMSKNKSGMDCVLQFDCIGRGNAIFAGRTNEMAMQPIHNKVPDQTNIFGFHTYGELAPLGHKNHVHNFSVVLVGLKETN